MKQRHDRPDIRRLLARRDRLGLTFREISEESGIPIPTLSYWSSKLRRLEAEQPATEFIRVDVVDEQGSGRIVLEFGSAVRVLVERGFDEEHLAQVVSVLARC